MNCTKWQYWLRLPGMETETKASESEGIRRGAKGLFQLGTKPGPGRPRGSKDKKPRVEKRAAEIAKHRLERLTAKAIDVLEAQLEQGDAHAARAVLAKVLPDERHAGSTVHIPELADATLSLEQKAQMLAKYLGEGRITTEQYQMLTRSLESTAKLVDVERVQQVLDLVKQGRPVYEAIREVEQRVH